MLKQHVVVYRLQLLMCCTGESFGGVANESISNPNFLKVFNAVVDTRKRLAKSLFIEMWLVECVILSASNFFENLECWSVAAFAACQMVCILMYKVKEILFI